VKTELLIQIQGINSKDNEGLLVLGATNRPWEIDSAIMRRFEQRIYVPLPNFKERVSFLKNGLGNIENDLDDNDYERLSKDLKG
jgi:vacuolar protein-sorting-associated protein 4